MGQTHRILIVEDEPNVRLVFRTALEQSDYQLATADDGEFALQALKETPADLVLLDLQMPRVNGMEVLRRLREAGNNVPVVIITAHGSIPDAVAAIKLGAIDFLSKPVTPEALRQIVAEVISRHAPPQPVGSSAPHTEAAHLPKAATPAEDPVAALLIKAKRALNHRDFDDAETLLGKVINHNPKLPEAQYLVGVLHELRGERHAAYSSYRAALQADPNYEPARLHLMKYFDDRLM
ncbi:MAG TPA: response regulator [Isosphaeraceae bacterium]|jgi:DNA-binding NtrC family response regulator|nr:response regulator [Isosphaeraceae bacterium]